MRMARANKQHFKYALYDRKEPVYALDADGNKQVDYVDEQGNVFYVESGETRIVYTEPQEIFANITLNAGDVQPTEFGIDPTSYDAMVVYLLDEYPIAETSLIWYKNEPTYDESGYIDPKSADYRVASVKPSLNYTKLLLRKLAN